MTTSEPEIKLLTIDNLGEIFLKYSLRSGSVSFTPYIYNKSLSYIMYFFQCEFKKHKALNKAHVEDILALEEMKQMKDHEVIDLIREFFSNEQN